MKEIPRLLNNQQNSMEDLIREILLQLPTKSLVRFKCVSKLWLSLISDSNFAKSHFELAAAPSHRFLYMSAFDHEARSLDLDASLHNGSTEVNLLLPLPDSSFSLRDLQILGSCRGFILLSNYPNLILWNPLTGIHKRLSYSPVALEFYLSIYEPMVMYGFGYDASTDDYLIVIAFFEFHDSEADTLTHLEFFSLRTNSWREIEGTHFPYSIPWVRSGLHFNGAVHWLANRHADDDESDKVIVVFDLIQKSLSEVSLPDCDFEYFFGDLRIMGGCLSLSYWQWGVNKTEIWVMKEYKVQSSWTKYEIPWNCISPIYSTKGGELVAYNHKGRLMKFNDKGQLIERCTFCDDPKGFGVAMYTESLLSLPSDFGEAREDDQQ